MPRFAAEVEFRFECESQEAVGAALRRLSDAAESVGFDLKRGRSFPPPPRTRTTIPGGPATFR